jgi:hypothetical protein
MGEALTKALAGGALGLKVGGTLFQARGERQTAEAIADAARFRKKQALAAGVKESARLRRVARYRLSSQRVAFAKAGVEMSGSPLEFMLHNAAEMEREAVNARIDAGVTASLESSRAKNAERIGERRSLAALIAGGSGAAGFGLSLLRE